MKNRDALVLESNFAAAHNELRFVLIWSVRRPCTRWEHLMFRRKERLTKCDSSSGLGPRWIDCDDGWMSICGLVDSIFER
jgi:hypothetical protein